MSNYFFIAASFFFATAWLGISWFAMTRAYRRGLKKGAKIAASQIYMEIMKANDEALKGAQDQSVN